jgi:hypothetical protein
MVLVWLGGCVDSASESDERDAQADPRTEELFCDGKPAGAVQTRERYAAATVPFPEACLGEIQTRICSAGQWQRWIGTYGAESCTVELHLSVYGDSVAQGGYVGPKTACGTAPSYTISPPPSQQLADAASAVLEQDRTIGGSSYSGLLAGTMGFAAPLGSLLTSDDAAVVVLRLGGNDAFMAVDGNGGVVPADFGDVLWSRAAQSIDLIRAAGKVPVIVGVPRFGRNTVLDFYCVSDNETVARIDAKVAAAVIADAKLEEAAAAKGALFIDVRTDAVPFADDDTYASDGVHPYPEPSNAMSRYIGMQLREALGLGPHAE